MNETNSQFFQTLPASIKGRRGKKEILTNSFLARALLYFTFLVGCSAPSTEDAERVLRGHIESESSGQINLVSFKKTDGQEREVFGVKGYSLFYEAEITFASDGVWRPDWFGSGRLTFTFSKTGADIDELPHFSADGALGGTGVRQLAVHSGDRARIGGEMVGQRSENGWKFEIGDNRIVSGPNGKK